MASTRASVTPSLPICTTGRRAWPRARRWRRCFPVRVVMAEGASYRAPAPLPILRPGPKSAEPPARQRREAEGPRGPARAPAGAAARREEEDGDREQDAALAAAGVAAADDLVRVGAVAARRDQLGRGRAA